MKKMVPVYALFILWRHFQDGRQIRVFSIFDFLKHLRIWVWHMFHTYFWDVEHNNSILNRIEGHLRPVSAILRSYQGQTLYARVTHVSYLIWRHKQFYIIINIIAWHCRSINAVSRPFQGQTIQKLLVRKIMIAFWHILIPTISCIHTFNIDLYTDGKYIGM